MKSSGTHTHTHIHTHTHTHTRTHTHTHTTHHTLLCRDCWPVYDKKQEAQFRKVCSNWLAKISKVSPLYLDTQTHTCTAHTVCVFNMQYNFYCILWMGGHFRKRLSQRSPGYLHPYSCLLEVHYVVGRHCVFMI